MAKGSQNFPSKRTAKFDVGATGIVAKFAKITDWEHGLQKYFHQSIRQRYPLNGGQICESIQTRYQAILPDIGFVKTSSNPIDRRLDFTAYFLATIQVLEQRGESFEIIRETCLEITHAYVRPKNHFQAWLKRLPVKIIASPLGWLLTRFMEKDD
ncbi:MAG: hypothetical protein IPN76_33565 [Saprospiraceae bacterium]|nr:hypothetical protein [Saprospiraceae bacterium]